MKTLSIPESTSSLSAWLYYIECLHPKTIDLGLDRIHKVANKLNLLRPAPLVIIVGGTNGKGTTCRLLENILLASGVRVGVYSSPHLLCYTERVRIHGEELPQSAYIEAMAIIEAGRGLTSLSYFEFGTLVALHLFNQASLDVAILEVGLGGRLDATNIIDADIAVITSIAIDHTDLLGSDRDSIAREKAGIFRYGKPAVVGEPDRPHTIDITVDNCGATLYACNRDWWWKKDGNQWHWWDQLRDLNNLPLPDIPIENAATALATVACLPFAVSKSALIQGLNKVALPGRFQCIGKSPLIILDVAHNYHAAGYLAQRLAEISCTGKVRAVVGMLKDKDIPGTLARLKNQVDIWYCATLNVPRGTSAAQLASHLNNQVHRFDNVLSAWYRAIADSTPEDCVLVFGSFYTVAPVISISEKNSVSCHI